MKKFPQTEVEAHLVHSWLCCWVSECLLKAWGGGTTWRKWLLWAVLSHGLGQKWQGVTSLTPQRCYATIFYSNLLPSSLLLFSLTFLLHPNPSLVSLLLLPISAHCQPEVVCFRGPSMATEPGFLIHLLNASLQGSLTNIEPLWLWGYYNLITCFAWRTLEF